MEYFRSGSFANLYIFFLQLLIVLSSPAENGLIKLGAFFDRSTGRGGKLTQSFRYKQKYYIKVSNAEFRKARSYRIVEIKFSAFERKFPSENRMSFVLYLRTYVYDTSHTRLYCYIIHITQHSYICHNMTAHKSHSESSLKLSHIF